MAFLRAHRTVAFAISLVAITGQARAADTKRGFGGGGDLTNHANSRWYYNWGAAAEAGTTSEFAPMIWGGGDITGRLATAKAQPGAQFLMGFNEPERTDQANMSVASAIALWPQMMTANMKLVSPAVSDTTAGRAWIADFMSQVTSRSLRVDAVAFHWYGTVDPANPEGSASGFLGAVDNYHNLYQRPIWITEWGGIDWGNTQTTATMNEANRRFLIRAIAGLESRSYVERYAWWNWSDDTRLNVNGATLYTPSIVGNEYFPVLLSGKTKDIAGVSQGNDYQYLRGGTLTNTGVAQVNAVRSIDAIDGTSTITGTGDWTATGDAVRVRSGATLQKTGANQVSFKGSLGLTVDGTLLVSGGTLAIYGKPTISGTGTFRVDAGGALSLGATTDREDMVIAQAIDLRGGTVAAVERTEILTGAVTLTNNSVLNSGVGNGALSVRGVVGGSGGLTFEGANTTLLTNTNTYLGDTYVDAGAAGPAVVRASRSNPFGPSGTIRFNALGGATTGRVELTGDINVPNPVTLSGRTNASAAIQNVSGNNSITFTVNLTDGGSAYAVQSDAGLLTFSATGRDADGIAFKSSTAGARTLTLGGAGDGLVSGAINNYSASVVGIVKQGAGTWTLSHANNYGGPTTVNAGTLRIAAAAQENVLTNAGGIDLQAGKIAFDYAGGTTPRSTLVALLAAGKATNFASGQIRSSTITAGHGIGWRDDAGTSTFTLVTALYGDGNLDGTVNFDDLLVLAQNYGVTSGADWASGDSTYDGEVNFDDLLVVAQNYGQAGLATTLLPSFATPAFAADWALAQSLVPEPTTLGFAALALPLLRRRRSTRRSTRRSRG